jgi:hypothetical protein
MRIAEMYADEVIVAPKRTFVEEFDYQVANDLCGGHCLNPGCFCDELEEEDNSTAEAGTPVLGQ